jgi:hypothetical protein
MVSQVVRLTRQVILGGRICINFEVRMSYKTHCHISPLFGNCLPVFDVLFSSYFSDKMDRCLSLYESSLEPVYAFFQLGYLSEHFVTISSDDVIAYLS